MTDNTQELDDRQHIKFNILVPFLTAITTKRQKENGNLIKDTETAYYDFAVDLIFDWHNKQVKNAVATAEDNLDQYWNKELDKQIEGVLDRLEDRKGNYLLYPSGLPAYAINISAIQAERAKLKEVK